MGLLSMDKVWDRYTVPKFAVVLFNRLYGCELLACPSGDGFIIGYGSKVMPNGDAVKSGNLIDGREAYNLCVNSLKPSVEVVLNAINWPLNEMQASVLIVAAHIEEHTFSASIIKMANEGRLDLIASQLLLAVDIGDESAMRRQEYLRQLFIGTREPSAHLNSQNDPLVIIQQKYELAKTQQRNWSE